MAPPSRDRPGARTVALATVGAVLACGLLIVEAALVLQLRGRFAELVAAETELAAARVEAAAAASEMHASAALAVERAEGGDTGSDAISTPRHAFDASASRLISSLGAIRSAVRADAEVEAAERAIASAHRLRAIGREAIGLTQAGRGRAARVLIQGGRATVARQQLRDDLNAIGRAVSNRVISERRAVDRQVAAVLLLCAISFLFLIAAWWGLIGAIRDQLGALRNAADEARLKAAIVESSADAIFTVDHQARILETNPRAERLLGKHRADLVGRSAREAFVAAPAAHTDPAELMPKLMPGARVAPRRADTVIVGADGASIPVEFEVTPTLLETGLVVRTLVLRDRRPRLAEERRRKQLEDRLRQSQKLEALGVLAGGVAHDFSNLLTAITAAGDRARAALPPDHPATDALIELESTAREAGGVTRSLLTFSRHGIAERRTIDLAELVRNTLGLVGRLTPASVRISSEIEQAEPLWVSADASQMQQVVINLVVNAADAMPEGGEVRVTLSRGTAPNVNEPGVLLGVTDEGTGVPEDMRERIFEPFFTTKAEGRGLGLGLSVIHGIVVDHGGAIDVVSPFGVGSASPSGEPDTREAPRGARFWVWLPEAEAPAGPRKPSDAVAKTRLVVIERDTFVRELIGSALERAGYTVRRLEAWPDPSDAVDADLVIADAGAPAPDGTSQRTLWLVETAGTGPESFDLFRLEKPFQMGELIARADAIIERLADERKAT